MLLFFILFIFFILHIQFLLRNIVFGTDEVYYFNFKVTYLFDQLVSQKSLFFALSCATCFALGYFVFYRRRKLRVESLLISANLKGYGGELLVLNVAGLVQVVYGIYLLLSSGFSYQVMAEAKMNYGFVFELRVFYLILLSHLLLNVPWAEFIKQSVFKRTRWILIAYVLIAVLGQARSAIFEIAAVVIVTQLMWHGDQLKIKYVLLVVGAMLVPNLVVLGRLETIDDVWVIIGGLFSFEYSILFNNMLSGVIESNVGTNGDLSFMPSLLLILPSPLRNLFGLTVVKSDFYEDLASVTGVSNGGFSLLAEMFSNFGWYAPFVFGAVGMLIGALFSRAARVGKVTLFGATAPLLYVAFVLAFRNDFGVFIKYVVQLLLIAAILNLVLQPRLGK